MTSSLNSVWVVCIEAEMKNGWTICAVGFLAIGVVLLQACGGSSGAPPVPVPQTGSAQLSLTAIATGLNTPVDLQQPKDGSSRLFVVEKAGTIRVVQNGAIQASPFLDVSAKVDSSPGEMGLLGLAFHPGYAQNRRFFVHYDRIVSGQIQSVIAEYLASASDSSHADSASERVLLTVDQPFENHKGGQIAFGPDGFLYIGLGDGGSEGDPQGNGQNLQTLLGKILRIDVDSLSGNSLYAIPADNPFASGGGLPEIWAYGLRNPWRFSFDRAGRLFAADVGQDHFEEIDLVQRGGNYGWKTMEGDHCYSPSSGCNTSGLILPIAEYDHSEGDAVIGGYVYAGTAIPSLQNSYIFGDLSSGKIWGLREVSAGNWSRTLLLTSNAELSSFGLDQAGEVYVVELGGSVMRLNLQ